MIDDDTIYLDNAATTPLNPDVLAAMMPFLTQGYGNPSSIYRLGQDAKAAIDTARRQVSAVLGCQPGEIVFTGGATESDNLALMGTLWHARLSQPGGPAPHLIVSAIEHHAVLHTAQFLQRQGFNVTVVPVDAEGFVDPADVEAALRPETALVSIMLANNEVGVIEPIAEIASVVGRRRVPFHTDAVQAAGALPVRIEDLGVDLLSLSAHKLQGPKGVGMLYVHKGTPIEWMQLGGGQEGGRRGGTENVAGIVGFGATITRAERLWPQDAMATGAVRDRLWRQMREAIPDVILNGPADFSRRLPNNLNVAFPGVQGETVLLALDMMGIAASAGSACTTGSSEPSHVLLAMGASEAHARASLRFTLSSATTDEQIDDVVDALVEIIERTRRIAGVR